MTRLISLLALLALTVGGTANAASPKLTQEVKELLSGIEFVPSHSDWKRLGPAAAEVLRDIAKSPRTLATTRGRAISALVHFSGAESYDTLTAVLKSSKAPKVLKRKAIHVLALGYGNRPVKLLKPFLSHKSRLLRGAAIKAFGTINSKKTIGLLRGRLKVEKSKYLRNVIKDSIE